jgi:hypothetical protein
VSSNERRFTPGPWRWDEHGEFWLVGGADLTILHVDARENYVPDKDSPDARLIAAAPELYEACQLAVTMCRCSLPERNSGHRIGCYVPTIEAALAKAEGR